MTTKLTSGQRNIIQLIDRDGDADGWAPVSAILFPMIRKEMPAELVEVEAVGTSGRGRARLTENGNKVVYAMGWI